MATSSTVLPSRLPPTPDADATSLLVCWQDPETRTYHAVALLGHARGEYVFKYLAAANTISGFRPLLGFPDLGLTYRSPALFPLFSERVLDPSRPDRPAMLRALNLPEQAGPLEFLARSGGRRGGDTLEVLPVPTVGTDWRTACTFLVHGVRYQPGAEATLARLTPGDQLHLEAEPTNPKDLRAVLVTSDGTPLGWVPNPLLDYVHVVLSQAEPQVRVVRANGPEVGHHMRLLVELSGTLPKGYMAPWASDLQGTGVE